MIGLFQIIITIISETISEIDKHSSVANSALSP